MSCTLKACSLMHAQNQTGTSHRAALRYLPDNRVIDVINVIE